MEEKLYPIKFEGKYWEESDVDEVFKSFYHSRDSLGWDNSVYIGDGLRILPNGEWTE